MLQLAMAYEFGGDEDQAKHWYDQIVTSFPQSSQARKATGAQTRLDSVGNVIEFNGQAADGKTVDLNGYRGKRGRHSVLGQLVRALQSRHDGPQGSGDSLREEGFSGDRGQPGQLAPGNEVVPQPESATVEPDSRRRRSGQSTGQ